MKFLTVSPSPHVHGAASVKSLMYDVVIALLPALGISIYFFGVGALVVTSIAIASCVLFEYLIQKFLLREEPSVSDGSAVVTGILLAFNVPANLPIWIIILGALVSIGVGKMTFGGLGNNPFNPALVGRVFLLISFPVQMTSWPVPKGFGTSYTDATTGATPLGIIKEGLLAGKELPELMSEVPGYLDLFVGYMKGSAGELSAMALLLGFGYMLYRKVITWHIPISIFLSVIVFSGIMWVVNPDQYLSPLFHLLTGGIMLGAIYMATDYVTSPMTTKGKWIYGIGIGILTIIIRIWGAYPEGISFAILIMNAFVPLINSYLKPKRFGKEASNG